MADTPVVQSGKPNSLAEHVLDRIVSHLQMVWFQTEWVDRDAVARVDPTLRGFVLSRLPADQVISTAAVIDELREQLGRFTSHDLAGAQCSVDPLMAEIVRRFGGTAPG